MNPITLILKKLQLTGTEPVVDEYAINWQDSGGTAYSIQLTNIACVGENIAWLQSSESDEYRLVVYQNASRFSWEPKTYNAYFGCDCLLLEWLQDHLIFIYKEKHDTYICSIKDGAIKTFNFHGSRLARQGDVILFQTYDEELENVERIKIPQLEEIEPWPLREAETQGLVPEIIISSKQLAK